MLYGVDVRLCSPLGFGVGLLTHAQGRMPGNDLQIGLFFASQPDVSAMIWFHCSISVGCAWLHSPHASAISITSDPEGE